jgi:hypothetical protein
MALSKKSKICMQFLFISIKYSSLLTNMDWSEEELKALLDIVFFFS